MYTVLQTVRDREVRKNKSRENKWNYSLNILDNLIPLENYTYFQNEFLLG